MTGAGKYLQETAKHMELEGDHFKAHNLTLDYSILCFANTVRGQVRVLYDGGFGGASDYETIDVAWLVMERALFNPLWAHMRRLTAKLAKQHRIPHRA